MKILLGRVIMFSNRNVPIYNCSVSITYTGPDILGSLSLGSQVYCKKNMYSVSSLLWPLMFMATS